MEVSIFDPAASVVYVNNGEDNGLNTVQVAVSIPLMSTHKIVSVERIGDTEDSNGRYAAVKALVEDPSFDGSEVPSYVAPCDGVGLDNYEVSELLADDFMNNYAGIQVDVYCTTTARDAEKKAKERKLSKDKAVVVS